LTSRRAARLAVNRMAAIARPSAGRSNR
jgi:hypothetical protein